MGACVYYVLHIGYVRVYMHACINHVQSEYGRVCLSIDITRKSHVQYSANL